MNICTGIVTMVTASTATASSPPLVHLPVHIPPSALKKQGMVGGRGRERWQEWTNKMH